MLYRKMCGFESRIRYETISGHRRNDVPRFSVLGSLRGTTGEAHETAGRFCRLPHEAPVTGQKFGSVIFP